MICRNLFFSYFPSLLSDLKVCFSLQGLQACVAECRLCHEGGAVSQLVCAGRGWCRDPAASMDQHCTGGADCYVAQNEGGLG